MSLRDITDFKARNEWISSETSTSLEKVVGALVDDQARVHCENLIGAVTIPLGVAGPLQIRGQHLQKTVYVPLATTEGALVASISRGCKAITEAGGAIVALEHIGATRGPVFKTSGIEESFKLRAWMESHTEELKQLAASTSSHLKLKNFQVQPMGTNVYIRFAYDTGDAMGMNMVTFATEKLVRFIEQETKVECVALAGNFDIDKKPAWLNSIQGRGRKGWAEVVLTAYNLEKNLKTTAEKLYEIVVRKSWGGSMMSGSLGFNAHFANVIAAFFAATGQDLAQVGEVSQGITYAEVRGEDLYFSVYMPDIMIGTVGGGAGLVTQSEARSIMGVTQANEIAEILVAAVLAGELSLHGALAEQTLATAHKKLGR
ncbi:MAG: hydroxymethylglutaryl-CoA reductase [Weeksellaceae bacterium]